MSDGEPLPVTPDGSVHTDLPCRDCAYNLRTLMWDGACPECGLSVQASRLPEHLRFGSYRSIRRTRLGIGLFAATFAVPAILAVGAVVAILCSSHYWNELHARTSLPSAILRSMFRVYRCSPTAASVLHALAVVLIAAPLAARCERRNPALAWAALGSAAVGACGSFLSLAWFSFGALPASATSAGVITWLLGLFGLSASRALLLAHLAGRLVPGRSRWLCMAVWLAVLLSALAVIGAALRAVTWLADPWISSSPGVMFVVQQPPWLPSLSAISRVWDSYGEALCAFVTLFVLWTYARTLQAALRGPTRALAAG